MHHTYHSRNILDSIANYVVSIIIIIGDFACIVRHRGINKIQWQNYFQI